MARWHWFSLVALAASQTGCGLLWIPVNQEFPGPVQGVTVVDAKTGRPIEDAHVEMQVYSQGNWIQLNPFVANVPPLRSGAAKISGRMEAERGSGGVYTYENCKRVGWHGIFFPLPLPLGSTLYEDNRAEIVASAPGYHDLWYDYCPDVMSEPSIKPDAVGSANLNEAGMLTFSLSAEAAGGAVPSAAMPIRRDEAPNGVVVSAHRGDSKLAPENTLSAFRSAVAGGADYVELDSRVSTDGTLWCWHDTNMDRTSDAVKLFEREKIPFAEMSDADLAKLDAGAWFDPRFAGERVATLADALDVIQAGSITLLERKTGSAEAHAKLLRAKGLIGRLIVQAFDWKFLTELHAIEPDQPMAALGDKVIDDARWEELAKTGVRIIAWNFQDTTPEMIAEAHRRGYRFWIWTADEPADWDSMLAAGVDGIITNRPRDLIAHMRSKS